MRYLKPYQSEVQNLFTKLPPRRDKDNRHPTDPDDPETYLHHYEVEGEPPAAEQCGLCHLVHAWTQKGHPEGVSALYTQLS